MSQAKTAATQPASSSAATNGTVNWIMPPPKYWYTLARAATGIVRIAYVYAPTSMKPAWPSEKIPVKPFSRFMDTATSA